MNNKDRRKSGERNPGENHTSGAVFDRYLPVPVTHFARRVVLARISLATFPTVLYSLVILQTFESILAVHLPHVFSRPVINLLS